MYSLDLSLRYWHKATQEEAAMQGSLALVMAANNFNGASYAMLPTDIIDEVARLET